MAHMGATSALPHELATRGSSSRSSESGALAHQLVEAGAIVQMGLNSSSGSHLGRCPDGSAAGGVHEGLAPPALAPDAAQSSGQCPTASWWRVAASLEVVRGAGIPAGQVCTTAHCPPSSRVGEWFMNPEDKENSKFLLIG